MPPKRKLLAKDEQLKFAKIDETLNFQPLFPMLPPVIVGHILSYLLASEATTCTMVLKLNKYLSTYLNEQLQHFWEEKYKLFFPLEYHLFQVEASPTIKQGANWFRKFQQTYDSKMNILVFNKKKINEEAFKNNTLALVEHFITGTNYSITNIKELLPILKNDYKSQQDKSNLDILRRVVSNFYCPTQSMLDSFYTQLESKFGKDFKKYKSDFAFKIFCGQQLTGQESTWSLLPKDAMEIALFIKKEKNETVKNWCGDLSLVSMNKDCNFITFIDSKTGLSLLKVAALYNNKEIFDFILQRYHANIYDHAESLCETFKFLLKLANIGKNKEQAENFLNLIIDKMSTSSNFSRLLVKINLNLDLLDVLINHPSIFKKLFNNEMLTKHWQILYPLLDKQCKGIKVIEDITALELPNRWWAIPHVSLYYNTTINMNMLDLAIAYGNLTVVNYLLANNVKPHAELLNIYKCTKTENVNLDIYVLIINELQSDPTTLKNILSLSSILFAKAKATNHVKLMETIIDLLKKYDPAAFEACCGKNAEKLSTMVLGKTEDERTIDYYNSLLLLSLINDNDACFKFLLDARDKFHSPNLKASSATIKASEPAVIKGTSSTVIPSAPSVLIKPSLAALPITLFGLSLTVLHNNPQSSTGASQQPNSRYSFDDLANLFLYIINTSDTNTIENYSSRILQLVDSNRDILEEACDKGNLSLLALLISKVKQGGDKDYSVVVKLIKKLLSIDFIRNIELSLTPKAPLSFGNSVPTCNALTVAISQKNNEIVRLLLQIDDLKFDDSLSLNKLDEDLQRCLNERKKSLLQSPSFS